VALADGEGAVGKVLAGLTALCIGITGFTLKTV